MRWLALCLALTAGEVRGEALCLTVLENGGPVSELEQDQPRRIVGEVTTIPGYPLLLVKPTNRYPLYTVRGMRFEELGAEYPTTGGFQYKFFAVRRDGSVIGFGQMPHQLWLLEPGRDAFRPLSGLRQSRHNQYDPAQDRLYQLLDDGRLYEFDAERQVLSDLDGLVYGRDISLPRYVPELKGHLAATDGRLWFRAEAAGTWREIELDHPLLIGWRLAQAPILVDGGGRVILDMPEEKYVFAPASGDADLVYSIRTRYRPIMAGGRALVWRDNGAPTWFERVILRYDVDAWLPDLVLLGPDGPEAVPGDAVEASYERRDGLGQRRSFVTSLDVPGHGLLLIQDDKENLYLWDGSRVKHLPQLDPERAGRFPSFVRLGNQTALRTSKGFFAYDAGLALEPLPVPFEAEGPFWNIVYSERFGMSFLGEPGGKKVWFTKDGRTYDAVENHTGAKGLGFVADLPGRRASLVSSDAGAALIHDCDAN